MADGATPALGLTIGATNLAAVTADSAVVRKPVLTLYQQRPLEVGVPSENPRLDEPGLVITGFVDRVGDPIGIVAADGSVHRSEVLLANGLRSLAYAATGGSALPANIAVTHPSHWGPAAVEALGSALSGVSEWSDPARPITLIPDAAATLFAVRANPGIPARGTVAVCDFGGSGTSITLMDAAGDYQPLAPTVRHQDFSGDLIDQALLTAVMANVPSTGGFDPSGTSAIGSLSRLRAGCRVAKEQLSSSTVTTLPEELPGVDGDIRLTRNELDDAIRDSLGNFVSVLDETLLRNGIRDLVAVVSVGGGAHIPAVTTMLSGHFRVPVVTTPRPQLAAAIGAALRAARGPGDTTATALTPAAPHGAAVPVVPPAPVAPPIVDEGKSARTDIGDAGPVSSMMPALAWSEADDDSRGTPAAGRSGYTSARPALNFADHAQPRPEKKKNAILPWQRLPGMVVIGTAVAVLLVGIAVAIGFSDGKPATTPMPNVSTPAAPAPAGVPQPASVNPAPAVQSVPPAPQVAPAQPADSGPPADAPADVPQAPVPQAPAPPPVPQLPPAPPLPPRVPIPAIPPIPHIPGISLAIPGFGR
ncbi:proline rich protein [Mycobacterium rhizamassiliense]|uniref:Proline rich protein n=1 Tax=Mycobacterium rhizamassiliense TaxID=1841860 RepID=A0A2U3NXH1_9MYCO|nr:Hsp70 family protein [Mycobacterium rhizamassiliense]SPM36163.1 proline rich protein [Mycobacterium rhizamassiliense]